MNSTYSIGPGELEKPGTTGGPDVILADPQWVAIQEYVVDGSSLPTTEEQFRNSLGSGAPKDLSDFTKLVAAYAEINKHCATWTPIFNTVVTLASHIYEYGNNMVPVYYPPILKQAEILEKEPGNTHAKETLTGILKVLEKEATGYQNEATAAFTSLHGFASSMESDQIALVGADGKSGLLKYYEERYSATSAAVQKLIGEIRKGKEELSTAEAEYKHDVIVAATTPTYAWIWPCGTVAAGIVAGIYGSRATAELRKEEALNTQIGQMEATERADASLMTTIDVGTKGIQGIDAALETALPIVQEVEGAWGAIATDIGKIVLVIEDDIEKVPPIIMGLGVEAAVRSWTEVAAAANKYRQTAYITKPTAALHMWKLEAHLTAPEPLAAAA